MTRPLYELPQGCLSKLPKTGHRGLWFDRFFDRYQASWELPEGGTKLEWLESLSGVCGEAQQLEAAVARRLKLVEHLGGTYFVASCPWHFATGLGLPNPVENGLTWHPTLGTPYLPGSGVKGLVRTWASVWRPEFDERRQIEWFGTQDRAGSIVWFDAIPTRPVQLVADVMTPHMGKWYESGADIRDPKAEPEKVPADWHDPVPVPFLATRGIELLFAVAPRNATAVGRAEEAAAELEEALSWLGAGAKTAVGYGLFGKVDSRELERALEHLKREKLGPSGRLEAKFDEVLPLRPKRQAEKFMDLGIGLHLVPEEDRHDIPAWKQVFEEVFTAMFRQLRETAAEPAPAPEDGADLEAELAAHQQRKPSKAAFKGDRKGLKKALKAWEEEKRKLESRNRVPSEKTLTKAAKQRERAKRYLDQWARWQRES